MKILRHICFSILLFPFVFIAVGFLLGSIASAESQQYDRSVSVTATVSKYEYESGIDTDGTPYSYYNIFVNYTFEDKEYTDVLLSDCSIYMKEGKTIDIMVDPGNPYAPLSEDPSSKLIGPTICVIAGVVMAIIIVPHTISSAREQAILFNPSAPKPFRNKKRFFWLLIPLTIMAIFTLLGIYSSIYFIIGTIISFYLTVVLWEIIC